MKRYHWKILCVNPSMSGGEDAINSGKTAKSEQGQDSVVTNVADRRNENGKMGRILDLILNGGSVGAETGEGVDVNR